MHVELVDYMRSFTYQYEHILQAQLMEFMNHLGQISKSLWIKSEHSSLLCIIKVIPLYILDVRNVQC